MTFCICWIPWENQGIQMSQIDYLNAYAFEAGGGDFLSPVR